MHVAHHTGKGFALNMNYLHSNFASFKIRSYQSNPVINCKTGFDEQLCIVLQVVL